MTLALARKYRPQNFLELIGQEAVVTTLKNAIETNRLHHAYLFCGVRGVGKTSLARILAKSINCEKGPTLLPCQVCSSCVSITAGNALDVIEIDGASNNQVDDVRELREQVKFLPTSSKYKIIIIDEVHMLTNSAFNALLKTLEEPPAHIIFIFATTEAHELPVTILSRCQKYDFRKVADQNLFEHLKKVMIQESIVIPEDVLFLVARCAKGSVRDALSLLDQVIRLSQNDLTLSSVQEMLGLADRIFIQDLVKNLLAFNLEKVLEIINQIDQRGIDLVYFAGEVLELYRELIIVLSAQKKPQDMTLADYEACRDIIGTANLARAMAQYDILFEALVNMSRTSFAKQSLDVAAVRMIECQDLIDLTKLVDQLSNRAPATQVNSSQMAASARVQNFSDTPKNRDVVQAPQRQAQVVSQQVVQAVSQSNIAPKSFGGNALATNIDEVKNSNEPKKEQDWYSFVTWLTREKPALGGLLRDARPELVSPERLEVSYATESSLKSMAIDRLPQIEQMAQSHFGTKLKFLITEGDSQKKKF